MPGRAPRHGQVSPSPLWAVVDLGAVVNVEDVDNAAVLVNPVDDAIRATPGAVTTRERPEQRLADPVWVDRKRGITELQPGSGNGSREQRAIARRAAGWKRISYCCPGSLVTRR